MAETDKTGAKMMLPPCSKCAGPTSFYRRVLDPEKGNTYELFECVSCGLATARKVPLD